MKRGTQSNYDVRVTPSVFDRLIDRDPKSPRDKIPDSSESVRRLKQSVQRDLEVLLNTRNPLFDLPVEFTEVRRSVASFGLPDFSGMNIRNPKDRQRLKQSIEQVIRTFEPRLTEVSVGMLPSRDTHQLLKFRIDAQLILEPTPEPVTFDMEIQLKNYQYRVHEGN